MKFQSSIRSLLVLASLAGIFIVSGCWDRTEVNDLGLITGAAIDRYDSKQIELSLQIFVPGIASRGGTEVGQRKDTAKASSVVFSARGINIADALTHLQEKISRKLFWGHAEVIIFGEAEARHGIWQDVDYLMRSPQPRESAFIYVSQGKAREALEVQSVLERNTSEAYRELAKNKLSLSVTLAELCHMFISDSKAAVLPWINKNPPSSDSNPNITISYSLGTAVFKGDQLISVLDVPASRGVLWLRNEIKDGVITVNPEGMRGTVSVKIIKSKTTLTPLINNNTWSMMIRIKITSYALQSASSINLMTSEANVHQVEKALNAKIERHVSNTLKGIQSGAKIDIFDFAGEFHRAYPRIWHENGEYWDTIFPKIQVSIVPSSVLLRPGLSNVNSDQET